MSKHEVSKDKDALVEEVSNDFKDSSSEDSNSDERSTKFS